MGDKNSLRFFLKSMKGKFAAISPKHHSTHTRAPDMVVLKSACSGESTTMAISGPNEVVSFVAPGEICARTCSKTRFIEPAAGS